MKQKTKIIQKEVNYMVNARPQFVSVVDKGANQTPFNVVKNLKGVKDMSKKTVKKARIKLVKKGAIPTSVRKLVFAKAQFADETAVKAYLDQHGWEGYSIVAKGKTFEAAAEDVTDENFSVIREVKVAEGISGFVGVVKLDTVDGEEIDEDAKDPDEEEEKGEAKGDSEEDDDSEEEEETAAKAKGKKKKPMADDEEDGEDAECSEKSATSVRKYDAWNAYFSQENTLTGVMKDGMVDGVPPGIEQVFQGAFTAVSNTLKSDMKKSKKRDTVLKIGADFANAVLAIDEVYNELLGAEDASKAEKKYIEAHDAFVAKHAEESANKGSKDGEEGNLIAGALANICKTLEKVVEKVDAIGKTAEEANTTAKKADKEVVAIKTAAPTKKGSSIDAVDDEGDTPATKKADDEEAKKDAEFAKKMAQNLMGIALNGARH